MSATNGIFSFIIRTIIIGFVFLIIRSPFAMLLVGIMTGMTIYHFNYSSVIEGTRQAANYVGLSENIIPETKVERCVRILDGVNFDGNAERNRTTDNSSSYQDSRKQSQQDYNANNISNGQQELLIEDVPEHFRE